MRKARLAWVIISLLVLALLATACSGGTKETSKSGKEAPKAEAPKAEAVKYPTKPVTFVIWAGAGSQFDLWGRALTKAAEKHLGQPIVYVSKTGGNTNDAIGYLLSQPADGYTISAWSTSLAGFMNREGYVAKPDQLDYLMTTMKETYVLYVSGKSQFKTLDDLIKYAKANPGKVRICGSRQGSLHHQLIYALAKEAGIEITYVPTEGGNEALTSVMGGHTEAAVGGPSGIKAQVEAGLIRPLVTLDSKRVEILPDVPNVKELGYKFNAQGQGRGIMVKKGVPEEVVKKIIDAFTKALDEPEWKEYIKTSGGEQWVVGREEFTKNFLKDVEDTKQYMIDIGLIKK